MGFAVLDESAHQPHQQQPLIPLQQLRKASGPGEERYVDKENMQRAEIIIQWQRLRATGSDSGWLKVIRTAHREGLDLNFPTAEGESILYKGAEHRHVQSVAQLLKVGVDVNLQITAMGQDYGNTALHVLVSGLRTGEESCDRGCITQLDRKVKSGREAVRACLARA